MGRRGSLRAQRVARDRTQRGDVELRIPKLRKGSFFPDILDPRRSIEQALYVVVMEAYVHGISIRAVDDLVEAMGVDAGIRKSEVSRICAGLDATRGRIPHSHAGAHRFPYVYLDATYLNVPTSPNGRLRGYPDASWRRTYEVPARVVGQSSKVWRVTVEGVAGSVVAMNRAEVEPQARRLIVDAIGCVWDSFDVVIRCRVP